MLCERIAARYTATKCKRNAVYMMVIAPLPPTLVGWLVALYRR